MPAWAIAFIVIGCLAVFAIVVGVIVGLSHRPEELDQEDVAEINRAGEEAELLVNNKIQAMITRELNGQGIIHRKFIFFDEKKIGKTTEIDSLVVTKAGIFIIEVKGWKGELTSCDPEAKEWTKVKQYHKTKYTYGYEETTEPNPIKQNKRHVANFLHKWMFCSDYKADTIQMVIFPYLENIPEGTYNIKSALTCIKELSNNGNRDITKIEKVIAKFVKKYGATEEDHIRWIEQCKAKRNMVNA